MSSTHSADGKPVIVDDKGRVGGVHESQESADAEVAKLKKLQESQGSPSSNPVVKKNLYG